MPFLLQVNNIDDIPSYGGKNFGFSTKKAVFLVLKGGNCNITWLCNGIIDVQLKNHFTPFMSNVLRLTARAE